MAKKYTAAEMRQVLRDVLCGAFEHMEAIKLELGKLGTEEEVKADATGAKLARAKVLTMTLVCINDIMHPAHHQALSLFGEDHKPMLDAYLRNHRIAVDQKMVPKCYCTLCAKMAMTKATDERPVNSGSDTPQ